MKKTYLQPAIITFRVLLSPLMVVSFSGQGSIKNISTASEEYDGETVLSRRGHNVWDDDDDDDNNY